MEKLKIYFSGKMAGLTELEVQVNFTRAMMWASTMTPKTRKLPKLINPATLPPIKGDRWEDYIIRDIRLLKDCNAIVMQPNWMESPGAIVERDFAYGMGIPVYYLEKDTWGFIDSDEKRLQLYDLLKDKAFQKDPEQAIRLQRTFYDKTRNY